MLTALSAVILLASGGYKRIERITTVLVAGVTLVTVVCVGMLPGTGYPVGLADLQEGFTLNPEILDRDRDCRGLRHVWNHRRRGQRAVRLSLLVPGKRLCPLHRAAHQGSRLGRAGPRVAAGDVPGCLGEHGRVHGRYGRVLCPGGDGAAPAGLVPEKEKMIETLSEMYVPAFGSWTKIFFLVGVWAVLFKTMYVSSAGNGRLLADFVGPDAGRDL